MFSSTQSKQSTNWRERGKTILEFIPFLLLGIGLVGGFTILVAGFFDMLAQAITIGISNAGIGGCA